MGKKSKGKKKTTATDASKTAKPARLSADAVEWHPPLPSFDTQQTEPISVAEADTFMEKHSKSPVPAQPSTSSVTPPSTHGEEPASGGVSMPPQPPTGDSAPASAISDVPPAAEALTGSGEPLEEAAAEIVEDVSGETEEVGIDVAAGENEETGPLVQEDEAAAAEVEVPSASSVAVAPTTSTTTFASTSTSTSVVPEVVTECSTSRSSQPADPGTLKNENAGLPEAVTKLRDAEAGAEGAVGTASSEGTARDQVPRAEEEEGGKEGGKHDAQGEDSTDDTSGPTDDDSSDLCGGGGGGGGSGKDNKEKGKLDYEGEGEGGGGIFANSAWRWGGIAALVGAVLVVGLRRR